MPDLEVHVVRAVLVLMEGTDPRAPGGEVTTALCGAWEHHPPCRWPHNNEVVRGGAFRTVFAAPSDEVMEVRSRIEVALRSDARWDVRDIAPGHLSTDERALGHRLAGG